MPLVLLALVIFLAAWTPSDPALAELYAAIVDGRYGWIAGVALIAAIEPVKRAVLAIAPAGSWITSKLGGVVLAFAVAALAGVGHALIAGAPWTWSLALAIVRNAAIAIGGYTAIKRAVVERWPVVGKLIGAPMPTSTSGGSS